MTSVSPQNRRRSRKDEVSDEVHAARLNSKNRLGRQPRPPFVGASNISWVKTPLRIGRERESRTIVASPADNVLREASKANDVREPTAVRREGFSLDLFQSDTPCDVLRVEPRTLMKPISPRPAAIILCGGESRRMQTSKAWLRFGGATLLQRVVQRVQAAADPVVVVAAGGQNLPPLPSTTLVTNDANPNRGPLEGLLAGLIALPDTVELVFATSTDAPFLEPAWITRLAEISEGHDCVIVNSGGFLHPLAALYRREPTRRAVESQLHANRLRLLDLVPLLNTKVVDAEAVRDIDPSLQTLRNLNTPGDYGRALRDA